MLWTIIGFIVFWILCGVVAYGLWYAFGMRDDFDILYQNNPTGWTREVCRHSLHMGSLGPIGLFAVAMTLTLCGSWSGIRFRGGPRSKEAN